MAVMQQMELLCQDPDSFFGYPGYKNPKLEATLDLLASISHRGEEAILFATRRSAQHLLAQATAKKFGSSIMKGLINGETKDRTGPMRSFRKADGFALLILPPRAAGTGLTLIEGNHVIHYGRWWNPAVEDQATSRAHRIGQTRLVHVHLPILSPPKEEQLWSIEERLDAFIESKRVRADTLLTLSSGLNLSPDGFLLQALAEIGPQEVLT